MRQGEAYEFGLFRLDAARRTLTRDGAVVVLTPTVLETLLYLVENPSRLVTKEELLGAVWPGRFVEEFNVTQSISVIRRAMRDAGDDGRLIVTVPGRGYRFTAEVRRMAETVSPDPAVIEAELSPRSDEEKGGDPDTTAARPADGSTGLQRLPRIDRRSALFGGGALAFAAAGAGVWAWRRRHAPGATSEKSIAVLPFSNLSGDPNQAYFSDGITEEVRDALAPIEGLRVIGRMSSTQVRDMSTRDIGAKLGVSAIVTGSVRRSPTSIRVSAQLIDVAGGDERWSHDFDRAPGDVLAIEDGIAKGVASTLDARLGVNEAFVGKSDPRAHDLYLKAMALTWEADDEGTMRQALALIDSALEIDPRYAKAHGARADCVTYLYAAATNMTDQLRLLAEAEQSARRAMALAPQWSLGHDRLGHMLRLRLNFKGALDQYSEAQRLDPDHISPTLPYFLALLGQADRAVAAQTVVLSHDPLNPTAWAYQAEILYFTRRYHEAIALSHQILAWAPKQLDLRAVSAWSLLCLGRPSEALDQVSALPDDSLYRALVPAVAAWRLGDRRSADAALARLKQRYGVTAAYYFVEIFAQRGEIEAALMWLEQAWSLRDSGLMALRADPFVDPLRNEPRFKSVLAKVGFP